MSSWITITAADLNDARVAELVAALRTEELGAGQTDPLARRIQTVVDEVRRCIAKCPSTPLDADPAAIPPGLKDLVVEKIFRGLKARLLLSFTDDEREAEKLYQKRLEQLIVGQWPVDRTDNPIALDPVRPQGGAQIVSSTTRKASRKNLAGL